MNALGFDILFAIYQGVHQFVRILTYILFIYAFMTWFVRPDAKIYRIFSRLCDPLLAPFRPLSRKLIQMGLHVDLSVWLAAIALQIIDNLLYRLLFFLL